MSVLSAMHGVSSTICSNLFVQLPYPKGDCSNQTIIVTGSNVGLGFEASKHLPRLGVGKLIMGVRNLEKGEAARREILRSTGRDESTIEVWQIDMDSYQSVQAFAARTASLDRLDGLVANAGIATTAFSVTEDNEKTITTNVVSTFLLCLLLLPKLRESATKRPGVAATAAAPRIVIPNSALHYIARTRELSSSPAGGIFARLNDRAVADMDNRYPLSKLLVLYLVRELAARAGRSGKSPVIINTPNPSYCKSQLMREAPGLGARVGEQLFARTTEEGSRALVDGLLKGEESNGQYLTNCHVQRPASFVTSPWGQKMQQQVFDELMVKLEKIVPQISSNI